MRDNAILPLRAKGNKKIIADVTLVKFEFYDEAEKAWVKLKGIFTFSDEDLCYEIDIHDSVKFTCLTYRFGKFRNFEVI